MDDLSRYVDVLAGGGVVACPTETLVGLLADARNERAVERVAELKGRPARMPIALLLPDAASIGTISPLPLSSETLRLTEAHWPGPLTILVDASPELSPRLVLDGKVGVRVPGPSPAAELVRAFGHPVTATSANLTGQPPVRSVDELDATLRASTDAVIPGVAPGGPPSTILDVTVVPPRVVRAGAVEIEGAAL